MAKQREITRYVELYQVKLCTIEKNIRIIFLKNPLKTNI